MERNKYNVERQRRRESRVRFEKGEQARGEKGLKFWGTGVGDFLLFRQCSKIGTGGGKNGSREASVECSSNKDDKSLVGERIKGCVGGARIQSFFLSFQKKWCRVWEQGRV